MIEIREITKDNLEDVLRLTVNDNQKSFVATNAVSIAQSHYYPDLTPLAIYYGDEPVGFLMSGIDNDFTDYRGEYWLVRFMIDKSHQGKGYGKKAMAEFIDNACKSNMKRIYLSTEPENHGAIGFYEQFGFRSTGKIEDGEQVMLLNL